MFILTSISSVFLYRCVYKNCVYLTSHLWVTLGILEYKIFSYWVIEVAMTCLQISKCDETVLRLGVTLNWNVLEILWWPLTCDATCRLHSQRWLASTYTYLWNSSMSVCCRMDALNFIILQKQQESLFELCLSISGNKMPTRYNRWFLLQILLLAQHVSGTTMPIIRSSIVLYRWLLLVVFGA